LSRIAIKVGRRRCRVANGVDLEEVLIDEPEPDHPRGQIDRVRNADIARPRVQRQEIAGQIPDQPVGHGHARSKGRRNGGGS
jgi:hypothetical protein